MNSVSVNEIQHKLIEKAKKGDEQSFETLILSCKGKAYSIAFRYLRNEEDALDALQESFIKIYRGLGKFNGECQFDTWVYRIVVNTCNDFLRKYKRQVQTEELQKIGNDDSEYEVQLPDNEAGPDEKLLKKENSEYIIKCMEFLSDEHRQAIILRDIKGFSYDEIAEILECSEGTVKSRISRARQKLKEIYLAGFS